MVRAWLRFRLRRARTVTNLSRSIPRVWLLPSSDCWPSLHAHALLAWEQRPDRKCLGQQQRSRPLKGRDFESAAEIYRQYERCAQHVRTEGAKEWKNAITSTKSRN